MAWLTCLLQEICDISAKPDATSGLENPYHARDFGSAKVDTCKAVAVRSALADGFLVFVCVYHHGQIISHITVRVSSRDEVGQGLSSVFNSIIPDEPPRGLQEISLRLWTETRPLG